MFWAPNGVNDLPEMRFEFLFTLIGKSTMDFLTGHHGAYSNPGTQLGPEQRFRRCSADGLNQSLVSFVARVIEEGDDHELNDTGARKWRKIQKLCQGRHEERGRTGATSPLAYTSPSRYPLAPTRQAIV